jgi:hypothetical protein
MSDTAAQTVLLENRAGYAGLIIQAYAFGAALRSVV